MTPEELAVPPTEAEVADVIGVLNEFRFIAGKAHLSDIVRRLCFQRDRLKETLKIPPPVLDGIDYLITFWDSADYQKREESLAVNATKEWFKGYTGK